MFEVKRRPVKDTGARQKKRRLATNSATWRKIRRRQLFTEPLCRTCKEEGKFTSASHVDHIDGDSYNNRHENLQSLCASCHSKKTVNEDGGFGRPRRGEGG